MNDAKKGDRRDDPRRGGALGNPDEPPPEEFAGFDDFGEYPEFRPEELAEKSSEERRITPESEEKGPDAPRH
jgi:hypothetical protein